MKKKKMNKSGIYKIENSINGHKYIGSAINIKRRWKYHLTSLRNGTHHSQYLQRAWNKYGEDSFVFSILIECCSADLIESEQRFIDNDNPEYNMCLVAGSPLGYKHTKETRAKVSASLIGNKRAAGHKHTEEWKKNNSRLMMGNKHSLGIKQSEETKRKKSIACTGKHLGSKPWLGRTHTEETKRKMSKAQKGKVFTEEHKRNLSKARRLYFANKNKELIERSI